MGIHGFMKNMQLDEPKIKKRHYENIYFDCNYLLHYLIYNCQNDDDLCNKINNLMKYFFENMSATKNVYLIFDGSHPHHLQKINPKKMTHEKRYKNKVESDAYDKQKISPHSKIVSTFKMFILEAVELQKKMYSSDFDIIVNDDTIEDEADFKILNSINDNVCDNICIVSKDSDMILIAYSLIHKKKIKIDILSNLRPMKFIDVNLLFEKYGLDYILIMLLLGNDYLPKISNIDYDVIIVNYIKYKKYENLNIIENEKINDKNLIIFLTYIILNKKVKFNFEKLDCCRFKKYFNNLSWCLKKYKVINNDNEYIEDTSNVVNIYNFIYS